MSSPVPTSRRRVLQTTALVLTGSLAGCTGSGESGADGGAGDGNGDSGGDDDGTKTVEVGPNGEFVFTPGTDDPLRISAGTEVEFVWKSDSHNVVVEKQPDGADWSGHEPIEDSGFSFSYTFGTRGTYEYYCQPHKSLGMVGEIVVE